MEEHSSSTIRVYRLTVVLIILVLVLVGSFLIVLPHLVPVDSTFGTLLEEFGVALLVAGVVGSGYEFMLRNAFAEEVKWTLGRIMNERHTQLDQLTEAGIKKIHRRLPDAHVADKFEKANESIRILQTWSGDFNIIGDTLVRAATQRECEVSILLLDPDSNQAKQRATDLGYEDPATVKTLIQNDIAVLYKIGRRCEAKVRKRIKVRLYRSTPVMPIYGYDDTNVVGTYWRWRHSQEGPQLVLDHPNLDSSDDPSDNPYLLQAVAEHLDEIWKDARTKELDWENRSSGGCLLESQVRKLQMSKRIWMTMPWIKTVYANRWWKLSRSCAPRSRRCTMI